MENGIPYQYEMDIRAMNDQKKTVQKTLLLLDLIVFIGSWYDMVV